MVAGGCSGAVLSRLLHVPETGSTNADLRQLAEQVAKTVFGSAPTARRRGADARGGIGPRLRAISMVRRWYDCGPAIRWPPPWRWSPPWRSRTRCGPAFPISARDCAEMAQRSVDRRAKLSGILLERTGDAIVIGMGINLASAPDLPDRATTALGDHGVAVTPEAMQALLADAMTRWVAIWREQGLPAIIARWEGRAHPPARRLLHGS